MTNHELTRDPWNKPICACGYRPDVLNQTSPIGLQWKAKADVLHHIEAERLQELAALHGPARRSPLDPFHASTDLKYPRAGVRQTAAGCCPAGTVTGSCTSSTSRYSTTA